MSTPKPCVYAIRYLDTDPDGRTGVTVGHFRLREQAEAIAQSMPRPEHVEVVER